MEILYAGEIETPEDQFDFDLNRIDDECSKMGEERTRKEERGKILRERVVSMAEFFKIKGDLESVGPVRIKDFLNVMMRSVSREAGWADFKTAQRWEIFKPALGVIIKNADWLFDNGFHYFFPHTFLEDNDPLMYRLVQDPENFVEPALMRAGDEADRDVEQLKEVDFEYLPTPRFMDDSRLVEFQNMAYTGERCDDPLCAITDLCFQLKYEDGRTEVTLNKIKELINEKGKRAGFMLAIIFLSAYTDEKVMEDGRVTDINANTISEKLQGYLLNLIESYLDSIETISGSNVRDISVMTWDVERTLDRSVVWYSLVREMAEHKFKDDKAKVKEEVDRWVDETRRSGRATGDGYLNLDNVLRLTGIYKKFYDGTAGIKDENFHPVEEWDNYARMRVRMKDELAKYTHFINGLNLSIPE